tara:strand:- start:152 stop:967 length:816 start_codon:yes stop_codon:yes gene_type:complete
MSKYLNDKYKDLNLVAEEYSESYIKADPFSHIVFDDFFNEDFLNQIIGEFPSNLNKIGYYSDHPSEQKFTLNDSTKFLENTSELVNFTNSGKFIKFLNKITNMERDLIPDPYCWGGGLHELRNNGFLNIHCDFNKHPLMKLDRRINVLIYLNHDWKESYGGSLELWDKEMKKCVQKIVPVFNRVVIFNTNDVSYHGNPEPIKHPDKTTTRKSMALYYYTNGRPANEISSKKDFITSFRARPNSKDSEMITYYKKIFWKFYLKKKGFFRESI